MDETGTGIALLAYQLPRRSSKAMIPVRADEGRWKLTWEAIVMFHAAGEVMEPDQLLKKHSPANASAYRKGDATLSGRTHSISGFKVDLGSANSKDQLEERVLKHLQEHAELYAEVARDGGHVSVGIGLMLPPKEPRTVTLTPRALSLLANAGITVHVTGYPCLDDKDEQ